MFIFLMGFGVMLGAVFPTRRRHLLIFGASTATIAIILFAGRLSAPLGVPTKIQVSFLVVAIVAEAILVRVSVALYRQTDERSLLLAILFAVGLHFMPMALAFGPICVPLGLVLCVSAGIGLWLRPDISLNKLWASDGLIKMAFAMIMYLM